VERQVSCVGSEKEAKDPGEVSGKCKRRIRGLDGEKEDHVRDG
jgi:hypothetical protein